MVKKIGIGFIGLGTVGEQVLTLIRNNQFIEDESCNIKLEVYSAFVRDINKKRNVDVSSIYLTDNFEEVINDPNIQICFECMGGSGAEKTFEIVIAAIKKGKYIIMSSKKCLALYMDEIIENANYYNVQLRFEATVGGAIPICKALMNMSKDDYIYKMYGVINATTNSIISLMEESDIDLNSALKIAKEKGIAENDSSEDIDGWDAVYKMKILSRIGMNIEFKSEKLFPISIKTIHNSKIFKSCFRQIFYIEKHEDNKVFYYIGPIELESNNILSNVKDSFNMIFIDSRNSGLRAFYGRGAGGKETASVMFEDLLDIFKNSYWFDKAKHVECNKLQEIMV